MNQRELSQKLEELARRLEEISNDYGVLEVANELIHLSNQNYVPGSGVTWDAVKPKKQGGYTQGGKRTPF